MQPNSFDNMRHETINFRKINGITIREEMCEIVNKCEIEERKAADILYKLNMDI